MRTMNSKNTEFVKRSTIKTASINQDCPSKTNTQGAPPSQSTLYQTGSLSFLRILCQLIRLIQKVVND